MSGTAELARLHLAQGRPARALEILHGSPADPESIDTWILRAWSEYALERFEDALRSAERGLAIDPESVSLHLLRAEALRHQNDLAQAESAILRALSLDPEDPELLCSYAKTAATGGQLEKASKLLERAELLDPGNANVRHARSTLHWIQCPGGGEREAREALAEDPDDVQAGVQLAMALSDRAAVDGMARHLRRAASLDPTQAELVQAAREATVLTHWAMWPLRPIARFGPMPVWAVGGVLLLASRFVLSTRGRTIAAFVWLAYAAYSWIAPPLLRWWLRRRR